jgi:hypothetical protein
VVAAFGGAIGGPFQFDDAASMRHNPTIDRLWQPSVALHPPSRAAVSGRPAVNYSLAVNHAINKAWRGARPGPARATDLPTFSFTF